MASERERGAADLPAVRPQPGRRGRRRTGDWTPPPCWPASPAVALVDDLGANAAGIAALRDAGIDVISTADVSRRAGGPPRPWRGHHRPPGRRRRSPTRCWPTPTRSSSWTARPRRCASGSGTATSTRPTRSGAALASRVPDGHGWPRCGRSGCGWSPTPARPRADARGPRAAGRAGRRSAARTGRRNWSGTASGWPGAAARGARVLLLGPAAQRHGGSGADRRRGRGSRRAGAGAGR